MLSTEDATHFVAAHECNGAHLSTIVVVIVHVIFIRGESQSLRKPGPIAIALAFNTLVQYKRLEIPTAFGTWMQRLVDGDKGLR